jgi:hypothetical protein
VWKLFDRGRAHSKWFEGERVQEVCDQHVSASS